MQWILDTLTDMKKRFPDAEAQLMGIMHMETGASGAITDPPSTQTPPSTRACPQSAPQIAEQEKEPSGALPGFASWDAQSFAAFSR